MKRNIEKELERVAQICVDEGLHKVATFVTTSAYDGGNMVELRVSVSIAAPGNPYRFRFHAESDDGEKFNGILWRSDTPGEGRALSINPS